jgi:hypothetical protein
MWVEQVQVLRLVVAVAVLVHKEIMLHQVHLETAAQVQRIQLLERQLRELVVAVAVATLMAQYLLDQVDQVAVEMEVKQLVQMEVPTRVLVQVLVEEQDQHFTQAELVDQV